MADSERIGPYRVIRRLGAGGMGEVVLAHDDRLDRLVAIKRLHDGAATPERRERFRREARIAARLDHPAIVRIHDVLHEAGHDYLIMEYVEGQTLRARCDAGPMAVSEVLGIAHQLALGMAAAHDLGVIHRDLKAENVLLTRAGRAKLTDFGIAKLDSEDTVTARGAVLGTFRAMSPEQALGRPIDHRSDLFSFGILLYEALTGESPFRAETPFLTVQRLVHDEPRPIAEIAPSLPAGLASLVHQLLAKEPLLRPRDFHEVADAMIELAGDAGDAPCRGGASLDGLPRPGEDGRSTEDSVAPARSLRSAPPPAPAPASVRAPRRRRRRVAALGVASLALAALGALVVGHLLRGGHSIVHIAVLDTDDLGSGGHTDGALLAAEVRNAVEIDMWRRDGLVLIPRGDIESYVRGVRATGKSPKQDGIQAAVGADEVLAIDLRCVPGSGSCAVTLQRSTSATDRPPLESFHLATDGLRPPNETVADYLAKLYPDHPVRHAGRAAAIDPESHARYLQLVQAYYGTEGGAPSSEAVLDEIARIRQRSPGSLDVLLFEAELLRHRYLQTDDPRTAQLAKERLDAADHLLPDSYGILSARFDLELSAGWLDEAYADLDRLTRLDPDSSTTHLQQAKSYYQRREYKAARGDVDAAVHRNPFSWRVYYYRALVFRALNDRYDTRAAIHDLLVRSPDNYGGLSLLAREERRDGRLVCAEQIYQKLVDREPLYDECLNLGYLRELLGRYREATKSFDCALKIRPHAPWARLDRAESLLLAGDADAARAQLRELRELLASKRRDDPRSALSRDDLIVETQALGYLGRTDSAAAHDARANLEQLLAAPDHADALYTAAQVYAYLGDHKPAVQYMTQYLEAGNNPAELRLPWFDDLQQDLALRPWFDVLFDDRTCEISSAP
jgi:tetratricopeptide (TPR) repeat protein